jgi:serine/threonine-protein kinase
MEADVHGTNETPPGVATVLHYQIRGSLGEGGFGQVLEAWDDKLHRSVAIKRLKNTAGPQPSASLVKEARLAASLQHAAFVKIHALEHDDNGTFIVMELVRGQTLKQWLQNHPPNESAALDIIGQLVAAMAAAHAGGLIHGDLKPSNLMLEASGTLRILDFGLATRADSQATLSLAELDPQGTIAYMAPERLFGAAPGAQSDIYAIGVILYELLAGTRPFANLCGLPLATALVQSCSDQWDYPASATPAMISLVRAMTAREPGQRAQDMAELAAQIKALAQPGTEDGNWLRQLRGRVKGLARTRRVELSATGAQRRSQTPGNERSGGLQRRKKIDLQLQPASGAGVLRAQRAAIGVRLRGGPGVMAALLWVLFLALLALGWLAPRFWRAETALPAYSESAEIRQGLDALRLFDRPGSLDVAANHFSSVLAHEAGSAAAVAGLSLVSSFRYRSDKTDETWLQKADADARQALRLNDQLALSHNAMAWVLDNQGQGVQALAAHQRALTLAPDDLLALMGKVNVLTHLRRFDEAKKSTEYGMQRYPQERIFADLLGVVHFEQGQYPAAEAAFRLSLRLQPDCVFAYASLSGVLLLQNRVDEALLVLQQGLQIRPNAMLFGNLGSTLFMRGDYAAAEEAFRHAVSPEKGNPADYLGWANLADTLLRLPGQGAQAREAYHKARQLLLPRLARSPNDVTLLSRMALYAAREGDQAGAAQLLGRALTLAPDSPNVLFRAALAYELGANRPAALTALLKARKMGYPAKAIEAEPDLAALRRDPAYLSAGSQG